MYRIKALLLIVLFPLLLSCSSQPEGYTVTTYNLDQRATEIGSAEVLTHVSRFVSAYEQAVTIERDLTAEEGRSDVLPDYLKVFAWDDSYLQISIDDNTHIYMRPDGTLEWEVHINERSDINVFTYDYADHNLRFLYQPALSEKEIQDGCYRPDSVVGSYAVYHAHAKNVLRSEDHNLVVHYNSGKAFHIYAPYAINGTWTDTVKCTMNIDTVLHTISLVVPTSFLDTATYPVIIDPVIGYDVDGASVQSIGTTMILSETLGGDITSDGTINAFHARVTTGSNDLDFIGYIYNLDGADNPDGLLAQTAQFSHCTNHEYSWVADSTDCGTSPTDGSGVPITGNLTSGTGYAIGIMASATGSATRYDVDVSYTSYRDFTNRWPTPPDPFLGSADGDNRRYSFYIDYTVSGGGGAFEYFRRRRTLNNLVHGNAENFMEWFALSINSAQHEYMSCAIKVREGSKGITL